LPGFRASAVDRLPNRIKRFFYARIDLPSSTTLFGWILILLATVPSDPERSEEMIYGSKNDWIEA
jgi:hypothetical protein